MVESSEIAVTLLRARDPTASFVQKGLKLMWSVQSCEENLSIKKISAHFRPHLMEGTTDFKSDYAPIPVRSRAFRGVTAV